MFRQPLTALGRYVKQGKVQSLEEIYLQSIPIKEPEIIDYFLPKTLKEDILKITPFQKQTSDGEHTRFKVCKKSSELNVFDYFLN